MQSRTWKREEFEVAKALGTSRALNTDGKADILHDIFLLDTKLRGAWDSAGSWFGKLAKEAEKKGKIPVLTLRRPRKHQRLAVISFDTFVSLTKAAGWCDTLQELPGLTVELQFFDVELPEFDIELKPFDLELKKF